ncbi:ATP-binding protein, partial [Halobacterium salinarum]|nr:ATP-binding protein [Halobacterium salinarum]
MRFDLNVLQHLGLRMYTSLPAVVSEYVANAWDAWATEVEIEMPQDETMSPDYTITIEDNGRGMTKGEVNNEFLVVGRNRRQDEDKDYVEKDGHRRKVMGRKGIGKLAGFGIADNVRIWTCKDGEYVEFELDYGEMRQEAKEGEDATTTYRPKIINEGKTNGKSGTRIVLSNLDRDQRPRAKYVRKRLARRFSVIGDDFRMVVNGTEVTGDERDLKERCEFLRTYEDEPISKGSECTVRGWIGTLPKPTPDNV